MKLIRRKKDPTPIQKALGYVKLGVRGLVAVRLLRNSFKHYRRARRLPMILGGATVLAVLAKVLRRGGGSEQPAQTWQTPAPAPAASTGTSGPTSPGTSGPTSPGASAPTSPGPTATGTSAGNGSPVEPAGGDGPELTPEGGDIAPDLEGSEKPSSPS